MGNSMTLFKNMQKILVTCPPMIGLIDEFHEYANSLNLSLETVETTQTLSKERLIEIVPSYDGWIIGDDPACEEVLKAGKKGNLLAAVKWGIGVDNVDFNTCKEIGLKITNTPNMFGSEVADISIGYVIGLARQTFFIDRKVRSLKWPKPVGISLAGKTAGVIGYGDIGRKTSARLLASEMKVIAYDPFIDKNSLIEGVIHQEWPNKLSECDFLIINCSLTKSSFHLLNDESFKLVKNGVNIVNVGRGAIIDQKSLINALENKLVNSVALDVFEEEPLEDISPLRKYDNCILGSHNASNTKEAVIKTSIQSITIIKNFLDSK